MASPAPDGASKDGRGRVLVVGGCRSLPGAVRLAAEAAMRVGAGKLQIAVCRELAVPLGLMVPEAMVIGLPETEDGGIGSSCADDLAKRAGRSDAFLVGPGMVEDADVAAVVAAILRGAGEAAVVLDAGALCALPEEPGLPGGSPSPP